LNNNILAKKSALPVLKQAKHSSNELENPAFQALQ
jgi:hypothetical protein